MRAAIVRVVTLGGLAVYSMLPARSADPEPWLSRPAFEVPAADLMAAVAALPAPAKADAEILLADETVSIDESGAQRRVRRYVYRILTGAGASFGSSINESWAPWRQKRPVIRARVIGADAVQHDLDESTLTEAVPASVQQDVFSDVRVLQGPLPAVGPGAVIETEIVSDDTEPLFAAGVVRRAWLGGRVPTRKVRQSLDAPVTLPLRWRAVPEGTFHEDVATTDGRRRVRFEGTPPLPDEQPELFVPEDADVTPAIYWSTGPSWEAVADAYAAVVEDRLAGSGLRDVVQRLVRGTRSVNDKVAAIVRYVHREVRYTGVEFGWSGIVPAKPAETLRRKYGDCKDKSVLLVGLLREAGISSHLALIDMGVERDVPADLPGLGLFDHVVVRVDTEPPLWIDATDEHAPPGLLGPGVEGRRALVVKRGVTALESIPEARSVDHRVEETREIVLAERGPARVVETTIADGGPGRGYRETHAKQDAATSRERYERYVQEAYGAKKLDRMEPSDPADTAAPFRLVLGIDEATFAVSDGDAVEVPIPLAGLTSTLAAFVPPAPTDESEARKDPGAREKPRRMDFLVPTPYVTSWRYRIQAPDGFAPLPLPGRVDRAIGPATLTADFRQEAGGLVAVDVVFDTGPRRWTSEQYQTARRALRDLYRENVWTVAFEQIGARHLNAGRLPEAATEFRRLAKLHPSESIHHEQLAQVFLRAGLGEKARAEARAASVLEPKSAFAQTNLGWILLHDTLGRELQGDFDLAGAETALQAAKNLDPKNEGARELLALVLEHGTDGRQFGNGARLAEAIDEYRTIRSELGSDGVAGSLLRCLGQAGRFEDMRREAEGLAVSDERNALLVAAVAASSGLPEAKNEAARLVAGAPARRALLAQAGATLLSFRRYPEAAVLFAEAFRDENLAQQQVQFLAILQRVRRIEALAFDVDDPKQVPLGFLRDAVLMMPRAAEPLRKWLSRYATITDEEVGQFEAVFGSPDTRPAGMSFLAVVDMAVAALQVTSEDLDDRSVLVSMRTPEGVPGGTTQFIVVREDERPKLLASTDDLGAVGRLVLDLLAAGDVERARRWLDFAREHVPSPSMDDPVASHPLAMLWSKDRPADPLAMRAAAAALQAVSSTPGTAIDLLNELRGTASEGDGWRYDAAIMAGLVVANRENEVLDVARRLHGARPDLPSVRALLASALSNAGLVDELETLVADWASKDPDGLTVLRARVDIAKARRDVEGSVRAFEKLTSSRRAEPADFNNHAWFLLATGRNEEAALALAQRGVDGNGRSEGFLHTLAAIQADLGHLQDARDTIVRKITISPSRRAKPIDAIVFGRIAELLSETELALSEYRKVPPETRAAVDLDSPWSLAKRWIQRAAAGTAQPDVDKPAKGARRAEKDPR